MERTRQLIPEGLAKMPPGPELAAVLTGVDLSRLSGLDCVTVLRAQHRQAAHEQARLMAAMVEVGLCGIGPDDQLPRMDEPDEFSADEIRGALAWTRSAANTQLSLAWDLIQRLPQVFAALDAGLIDVPKTKAFSEWTGGLTDEQAQEICECLLPEATRLTTGQLIERIKKMAIAIDPDWARRKYEEAVRDRKVVGYRNEDGSANLCGYSLPAERAAAACAHIDALAKKIKRAGNGQPIDHIKADFYLAMLDGSYTGWTEQDIITHMTAAVDAQPADNGRDDAHNDAAHNNVRVFRRPGGQNPGNPSQGGWSTPDVADGENPYGDRPDGSACGVGGRADGRRDDSPGDGSGSPSLGKRGRPTPGGEMIEGPWAPGPPATQPAGPPMRRAGVEIRAEITMLLGLNAHPAEIAGWGFIHPEAARELVFDQTAAEWRFAITDDDGRLLYEGITSRRPGGYPPRAKSPSRGGIVELHSKLSDLRHLALRPARLGRWAAVIVDLARQADQHRRDIQHPDDRTGHQGGRQRDDTNVGDQPGTRAGKGGERGGRSPGVPLRRRTQIRDRTCVYPGCRAPAHSTDGDHTRDWAHGGSTVDGNIASLCRHDHRVKHDGGWALTQPRPGYLLWTTRLGVHYRIRSPLIIEPLPDPIPRDPPLNCQVADGTDPHDHETPTWREPEPPKTLPPRPPPAPDLDEIPPF